jgi:membrane dipeptidase
MAMSERTRAFYSSALVWDEHTGFTPFADLDLGFLSRWLKAGASYACINVGYDIVLSWEDTLRCTAHFRRWLEMHPETFILAEKVSDVRRAKREGKLAVAFDLEGANALDGNIDMITVYYRLGVRHMHFAYNKNNLFGGGCLDVDIPLTPLGREAVAEMNRVGMILDCSHTGYRSSMEIMEMSRHPVIFSHSNPRALCDHPRNIRDDQINAAVRTGGVIGINGVSNFLGGDCTSESIVRHIDYVVQLAGPQHLGLGLDTVVDKDEGRRLFMAYPGAWPGHTVEEISKITFAQPEQLPEIAELLLRRGYADQDVRGILGENFARVASQVWQ